MLRLRLLLKIVASFCIFKYLNGTNFNDTETLYRDLFSTYVKELRPGLNQSEPLVVSIGLYLSAIAEFDELKGKLSIIVFFEVSWVDHRISWNPANYGGKDVLVIPEEKVWLPSLYLSNTHNSLIPLRTGELLYLSFQPNGVAKWNPGGKFESICDTDPTYYPFDKQNCGMLFYSSGYDITDVIFRVKGKAVDMSFYDQNAVWDLLNMTGIPMEFNNVSSVSYTIQLGRKPQFFIVTLLLPILFMGLLNILVFVLPAGSGERVSYSVTILLAFGVYLSILATNLPTSANPDISVICYLLFSDLAMGSAIMFCTIFGLVLYEKETTEPVPEFIIKFVTRLEAIRCVVTRKIIDSEVITNEYANGDLKSGKIMMYEEKNSKQPGKIMSFEEKDPRKMDNNEETETPKLNVTWKKFARILDFIFIAFFILWIFVSNVLYLSVVLR